jgi:hypothetical protein
LSATEAEGGKAGEPAVEQRVADGADDVRDPGEPSKAAASAGPAEAAPDAAHRPGAEPAASRDSATAEPTALHEPAEPARPEPARPEPARPEPARPEPARPEPARPAPASAAAGQASAPDAASAGLETTDEPADGSAQGERTGSATGHGPAARDQGTEVTVVPGITRYHRVGCILIRFLGPEDLETMTLRAAEAASYVACRACLPEQQLAGD